MSKEEAGMSPRDQKTKSGPTHLLGVCSTVVLLCVFDSFPGPP